MGWKARDIPDQSGRVAVVTGGNGGLGLETARQLAAHGATVVIGARNLEKAETARSQIESTVPGAAIGILQLDLGSLASIAAFTAAVKAAHPRVDLLFNNAGVMAVPEGKTVDGFETQDGLGFGRGPGRCRLKAVLGPFVIAAAIATFSVWHFAIYDQSLFTIELPILYAVAVLVVAVEVEAVELIGTCMLERGVKAMGELSPVEAIAAHTRHLDLFHLMSSSVPYHAKRLADGLGDVLRKGAGHLRGNAGGQIPLRESDLAAMVARCQKCHRQEFADWQSGAHAATYSRIFLDRKKNA